MDTIIKAVERSDEQEWRELWRQYLDFYHLTLGEDVYGNTFAAFFDSDLQTPNCIVAVKNGRLVGLCHYLLHSHCWKIERVCYLQDLFVAETERATGVGRALIEAVYAEADKQGAPTVYWLTEETNHSARKLYDRIGRLTPFLRYMRTP